MKRLLLFTMLVLSLVTSVSFGQTKKVLLEEFTGSWCGWCPRGIWAIEQLEAKYPGKFITVSIHNQDPMTTPAGDSIQAGNLLSAITSFPNGWLQRRTYPSSLSIDATAWDTATARLLNEPATANVTVDNVTFDPATRVMTAKVTVAFLADAAGDFRINMYVVEDSVSGPAGTDWDQHNYLTNRGGYEDNPFYSEPAVVENYQHMHVLRATLGGITGIKGIIPATVKNGDTYSTTFTYTVPPFVKADQARVVGFAFPYKKSSIKSNEILNVDQAKVTSMPGLGGVTGSSAKNYITATRSAGTDQQITLTNANSEATTVVLSIDELNTGLPTGWQATVAPTEVTVPANGTATATLTFNAPANAGYAVASVSILPKKEGFVGHQSVIGVNALSAGTKYVSYGGDYYVINTMPSAYVNDFATIPFNQQAMDAYPASNFEVGIIPNIDYLDFADGVSSPYPSPLALANSYLDANKKVMITSMDMMYNSFDNSSQNFQFCNTPAAEDFMTKLGITYLSQKSRHNSSGTGVPFKVTGVAGDYIGDGVDFTCQDPYYSDLFTLDNANSVSCFYFDSKTTSPAGVHFDGGNGQRLVYLGFRLPYIADASTAETIVSRSMDFLINGINAVKVGNAGAEVSVSNFPNPAASSTKFQYSVTERGMVSLSIRDIMGREVASVVSSQMQDAGTYEADFNVSNLANGSYTYVLTTGTKTITNTLNVVK